MRTVQTSNRQFNCRVLIAFLLLIQSCSTLDVYEKTVALPGQKWAGSNQPEFQFSIQDTAALYHIFFVIRHTEKYNYKNIFLKLHIKEPGSDSIITIQKELILATDKDGWLGTAMNDIYEHRINLSPQGSSFPKPGIYSFRLEQIMREQPLAHVLNAGIRIEKK